MMWFSIVAIAFRLIDRLFHMNESGGSEMMFGGEAEYEEALCAMEKGDESAKTKVAFCKLSGRNGVDVNEEEAVVFLKNG